MPVTLPITYRTYCRQLEQGGLDLSPCRCPRCRCEGLRLTRSRVDRPVLELVEDACGFCGGTSNVDAGPGLLPRVWAPASPLTL
jgi:hypothetical protein